MRILYMYTFQFYSHSTAYILFLLNPLPYSCFFLFFFFTYNWISTFSSFMFSFILYITHRVQSTLTIYTISQGCYTSTKLTPLPSQQSTTASSSSLEEKAQQPLLHPSWNVYWLCLVQKPADVVSSWVHQYLQYRRHILSPALPIHKCWDMRWGW